MATTYELITSQTLGSSAASVTFSSIPQTFDDLVLCFSVRGDTPSPTNHYEVSLTLNGSTANFSVRQLYGDGSSAASNTPSNRNAGLIGGSALTANTFATTELCLPNYTGSTNKSYSYTTNTETNATLAYIAVGAGLWADTSAISSLALSPTSNNFVTGSSFYLYGVTHA